LRHWGISRCLIACDAGRERRSPDHYRRPAATGCSLFCCDALKALAAPNVAAADVATVQAIAFNGVRSMGVIKQLGKGF
jgi:hypothetical protein